MWHQCKKWSVSSNLISKFIACFHKREKLKGQKISSHLFYLKLVVNWQKQEISTEYLFHLPKVSTQNFQLLQEVARENYVLLQQCSVTWKWLAPNPSVWPFIQKHFFKGTLLGAKNMQVIGCGLFHQRVYHLISEIFTELILGPHDISINIGMNHVVWAPLYENPLIKITDS